jgi:hypothetical protein
MKRLLLCAAFLIVAACDRSAVEPRRTFLAPTQANHNTFTFVTDDGVTIYLEMPYDLVLEAEGQVTPVTFFVDAFSSDGSEVSPVCTPASGEGFMLGSTNVTCSVTTSSGFAVSRSFTVTVVDNTPPMIVPPPEQTVSTADPAGVIVDYPPPIVSDRVKVADVNCSHPSGSQFSVGTTVVTCTAIDQSGNAATTSFRVIVALSNEAPTIKGISLLNSVVAANTVTGVSFTVDDNDQDVTRKARVDWGDGSSEDVAVPLAAGTFTIAVNHYYSGPGVYTVTVSVQDDVGSQVRTTLDFGAGYLVVYDPSAGFVTGAGWFNSPNSACRIDYCAYNNGWKATFGFVSKYVTGKNRPDGSTEFQFREGSLNFKSTSYETLVVSGNRAQYWGAGTVNGNPGFTFRVTAVDGQLKGADGLVDMFRIEIWASGAGMVGSGALLYDNQFGAPQTAQLTTTLGGGSITIKK